MYVHNVFSWAFSHSPIANDSRAQTIAVWIDGSPRMLDDNTMAGITIVEVASQRRAVCRAYGAWLAESCGSTRLVKLVKGSAD